MNYHCFKVLHQQKGLYNYYFLADYIAVWMHYPADSKPQNIDFICESKLHIKVYKHCLILIFIFAETRIYNSSYTDIKETYMLFAQLLHLIYFKIRLPIIGLQLKLDKCDIEHFNWESHQLRQFIKKFLILIYWSLLSINKLHKFLVDF